MTPARPVWLPWLPLLCGAVGVVYGMLGFWVRGYDNFDRAFILFAAAYLVHIRQQRLITLPDTPRTQLGVLLVILGALAYLPPWFVYTQIGPRPVILWWEALALLLATAGMILIRSGPRLLYECRFMLIFPLFALPLPGRILIPLNEIMQSVSADLGAAILPWTGVSIVNKIGNHIMLRNGQGIEVAEMCSGVVMIRTTLALAALLAHLYGFGMIRSLILLALTLPIIIFVNALRVTAFGYLQDSDLTDWVQPGWKHELVGYLAYIPGLFVVIAAVNKLKPKTVVEEALTGPLATPSRRATLTATAVLAVAAVIAVLATLAPGVGRSVGGEISFDDFPAALGRWTYLSNDDDPPAVKEARQRHLDVVRSKLTTNAELNRNYIHSGGDKVNLWLLYWQSAMVVKDYHHPDICNTMQGFETTFAETVPMVTPSGRRIPVTYREIKRENVQSLVVYWTQEGRRLWTDDDERKARSFLFPMLWTQERLQRGDRADGDSDDRLQVYLTLPLMKNRSKDAQKAAILDIAARAADELYARCPWADPGK